MRQIIPVPACWVVARRPDQVGKEVQLGRPICRPDEALTAYPGRRVPVGRRRERASKGSGKAVEGQGYSANEAVEGQGKAAKRQWKVKERQWKAKENAAKEAVEGQEKAGKGAHSSSLMSSSAERSRATSAGLRVLGTTT